MYLKITKKYYYNFSIHLKLSLEFIAKKLFFLFFFQKRFQIAYNLETFSSRKSINFQFNII